MNTKVMIIGAGPYGIGLAYELQRRGVPFVIAGHPMSLSFDHTIDGTAVRSDWHSSEIFTHDQAFDVREYLQRAYPESWRELLADRLPVDVFRSYLRDVLRRLPFKVREQHVTELWQAPGGFVAQLEGGERIEAETVICATGIEAHRYLPESLARLDPDKVIHTWNAGDFSAWREREVLVVGAGQSAGESATLLKEHNRVTWAPRRAPIFYSEPLNLPVFLFKLALRLSPWFYFLPRALRRVFGRKFVIPTITPDLQPALTAPDVEQVIGDVDALELSMGGDRVYSKKLDRSFDAVVAATGYRYHVDNLRFIAQELRDRILHDEGTPRLNYDFESSVKRLFIVGGMAEPAYGPAQRFMMGAAHSSARLGQVVAQL